MFRGLDVAVNDTLLVRVLDGLANFDEQVQSLRGAEFLSVAVSCDGNAAHEFHDKVRAAVFRGAAVEDFGDVRMIHEREGLALGLEAGDDLFRIHAQLDDLEGDTAFDRVALFRGPDGA